ncbi:hypothetical protein AVEN_94882-1, partial [Araneus ventricosus]
DCPHDSSSAEAGVPVANHRPRLDPSEEARTITEGEQKTPPFMYHQGRRELAI